MYATGTRTLTRTFYCANNNLPSVVRMYVLRLLGTAAETRGKNDNLSTTRIAYDDNFY